MLTSITEFKQFINEQYIDLKSYNFKSLFNTINKECFNNSLEYIPIKIVKSKTFSGQYSCTIYRSTGKIENEIIKISNTFLFDENKLKNILCHELIHAFVAQNYPKEKEHHGYNFKTNMYRINKLNLGYNITLTDDEPTELNTKVLNKTKEKLFIISIWNNSTTFVLTHMKNYHARNIDLFIDKYNLTNVTIYTTTSLYTNPITTTNSIKLQKLKPEYNYLLDKIINDTEHTQIKKD